MQYVLVKTEYSTNYYDYYKNKQRRTVKWKKYIKQQQSEMKFTSTIKSTY